MYDTNGNCVASYTYNAWGEHTVTNYTSANIGNINPFRYRGYYYDTETGFYYLNARYYDPQIKRFINADSISYLGFGEELQSFNLYSYYGNTPVMGYDLRSWRNGATQDQILDARNKAFAGTFISYGIGWGIGTYFGLSEVYELNQHMWINVGIELFGEVLGEIIGE